MIENKPRKKLLKMYSTNNEHSTLECNLNLCHIYVQKREIDNLKCMYKHLYMHFELIYDVVCSMYMKLEV